MIRVMRRGMKRDSAETKAIQRSGWKTRSSGRDHHAVVLPYRAPPAALRSSARSSAAAARGHASAPPPWSVSRSRNPCPGRRPERVPVVRTNRAVDCISEPYPVGCRPHGGKWFHAVGHGKFVQSALRPACLSGLPCQPRRIEKEIAWTWYADIFPLLSSPPA